MKMPRFAGLLLVLLVSCREKEASVPPGLFTYRLVEIDGNSTTRYTNVRANPVLKVSFSAPINRQTVGAGVSLTNSASSARIPFGFTLENADSTLRITPKTPLDYLTRYSLEIRPELLSQQNAALGTGVKATFVTAVDTADKFPRISDDALLDMVQRQTLRYFVDFAHPVSGMARERNSSGDVVTTGGTGFGVLGILAGIERGFIARQQGYDQVSKIVGFLQTKATPYHGAFSHWINGNTGATVPFSTKDNGADLVETAFLMQGLLAARQYFNPPAETSLPPAINKLWEAVEWNWFRKNNENVLYWHWSPDYNWDMNMKVSGWNESLIVYVLAASSPTHPVPKQTYTDGWARNGGMANNKTFYGIKLPLGPDNGGPLFFAHYSFLGIDPRGLSDAYASYWDQNVAHSRINHQYCKANPRAYNGYSEQCWGLTASDNNFSGYAAHEPNNDLGIITPTAALSSMPYTPDESMKALRFFYYKPGDKIWKNYGFVDAFNLTDVWYADSFLAIDQGPIIVMIENHRSQLLWNLFMGCPEVKNGMAGLGFKKL